MTDTVRFVRRNRVDERYALAIAAIGGLVAALAGAHPTGSAAVDAVLVSVTIGAVVWASASAPWWATAAASGIAAVVAFDAVLSLIGAAGFVVGLVVGIRQRDQSEIRAIVGAVAMNIFIRSQLDGFLGLSAIIGVSVGVALFVLGARRRPGTIRRIAWISGAVAGGVMVVALVGLAVSATSARPDITNGARIAKEAIATLNDGDYSTAADQFAEASNSFRSADQRLGGVLAAPSRLVPVVSQNATAAADLSAAAAAGTADAAAALRAIDPASLTVVNGTIDLDAIEAVEAPLLQVKSALEELREVTDDVDSPWLLDAIQTELADLDERLDQNEPRLDNAIAAVQLAPRMLGDDGERRYLILFTTPAEARGLGGFTGNFAEITVTDGRIGVTRFGRTGELNAAARDNQASCEACPAEFLDRYSRFGFDTGPDGTVGTAAWSNLPVAAHFPYVAETASVLYPQSDGAPIDGVAVMDPYVLQALMGYTGPIEVPELGVTVEPSNAAEFILRDQYVLGEDTEVRVEALDTLGQGVIAGLLTGGLPEPSVIARDLGPLIGERRLLLWTDDADEQELLERTGLLGSIPALGDDGGFSVSVTNAGESKIDVFLDRDVDVRVETADDGSRRLVADVTLTNNAPASGLPPYVIGNNYGLPSGTSRMFLTFYGPAGLTTSTRNGEPVALAPLTEAGWFAYGLNEEIGPGEQVDYRLEFQLPNADDTIDESVVWWQPLADRRP
jgi:hypothetical protein